MSITFIDKTDPSKPLKRENYWRSALKTMAPLGLNTELRNVLRNHGQHVFGQDLCITIVVNFIDYLL